VGQKPPQPLVIHSPQPPFPWLCLPGQQLISAAIRVPFISVKPQPRADTFQASLTLDRLVWDSGSSNGVGQLVDGPRLAFCRTTNQHARPSRTIPRRALNGAPPSLRIFQHLHTHIAQGNIAECKRAGKRHGMRYVVRYKPQLELAALQ
jgi:hypothetical protein